MELNVAERLVLLNILPAEGDLITLRIVQKMRQDLGFTEEEIAALELRQEGTLYHWKREFDVPHEIALGPKAREIVRERLETLNKEKKLTEQHLSLCDKFEVGTE